MFWKYSCGQKRLYLLKPYPTSTLKVKDKKKKTYLWTACLTPRLLDPTDTRAEQHWSLAAPLQDLPLQLHSSVSQVLDTGAEAVNGVAEVSPGILGMSAGSVPSGSLLKP